MLGKSQCTSLFCVYRRRAFAVRKYGARCKQHIFWLANAFITHDARYLEFNSRGLLRYPSDLHPTSNASNCNAPVFSDATFDPKDISYFRNSENVIRNVARIEFNPRLLRWMFNVKCDLEETMHLWRIVIKEMYCNFYDWK